MKASNSFAIIICIASVTFSACSPKLSDTPAASASPSPSPQVTEAYDFPTCKAKGNPIQETYPQSCRDGDQIFVENLDNEQQKQDLIQVSTILQPTIKNPLQLEGKARGSWFFEGSFPIKIVDEANNVIGTATAKAKGEWTTTDFVPFMATLKFKPPQNHGFATLILEKDNPSGLSENADQLIIPVSY